MPARKRNRGLIYLRRSSPGQESSFGSQLTWGRAEAKRYKVILEATSAAVEHMQAHGLYSYGDIRLDDGVTGANLERPGFAALRRDALCRPEISHLFICRRDRAGRPEEAIEMVQIEKELKLAGITIVFSDKVSLPTERGQSDLAEDLAMFIDYYQSGAFLREHAERVIATQRSLAHEGFTTGGRPPFGFARVLVDAAGNEIEVLPPGKRVRQPGCHVRWIPQDESKIEVWLLILDLREKGWGIKRIAEYLNRLGIPSPDAGRVRTDNGVPHVVSGTWCPGTVSELCRNSVIIGVRRFGRRSEGAHRRLSAEGYRPLTSDDRTAEGRPRVIFNDESTVISRPLGCDPRFDADRWERLQGQIDERGRTQRGTTRQKDLGKYPLSLRMFDQSDSCGHPLYGRLNGRRPIYVCGRYMKTSGAHCNNNCVDAEAALTFTLKTLRQLLARAGGRERVRERLLQRALQQRSAGPSQDEHLLGCAQARVSELSHALETTQRRLAMEDDDDVYQAVRAEYKAIKAELRDAEDQLAKITRMRTSGSAYDPRKEVDAAMAILDDTQRITSDPAARREINPLLRRLGVRLGLYFTDAKKGQKRRVRKLTGGVMVFGDKGLPVPPYGVSNRDSVNGHFAGYRRDPRNGPAAREPSHRGSGNDPASSRLITPPPGPGRDAGHQEAGRYRLLKRHREGVPFTKVNRGDRIRTCDLLHPMQTR